MKDGSARKFNFQIKRGGPFILFLRDERERDKGTYAVNESA